MGAILVISLQFNIFTIIGYIIVRFKLLKCSRKKNDQEQENNREPVYETVDRNLDNTDLNTTGITTQDNMCYSANTCR